MSLLTLQDNLLLFCKTSFDQLIRSECFGLLGVNGAGKTSAFKMLTGDETITQGEAWIRGLSLKNEMNKVRKIIGYCPQFDALIVDMTGRETLEMFCLLRGIPKYRIKSISVQLAADLNFLVHIDKKVKGNARCSILFFQFHRFIISYFQSTAVEIKGS